MRSIFATGHGSECSGRRGPGTKGTDARRPSAKRVRQSPRAFGLADGPILFRGEPTRERARTFRSLVPPHGDAGRSVRAGLGRPRAAGCRAGPQESPPLRGAQRPLHLDVRGLLSSFAEAPTLVPSLEHPLSAGTRGGSDATGGGLTWGEFGASGARTPPSGRARPAERASPGRGGASRRGRAERRRDSQYRRQQRDDRPLAPARRETTTARFLERRSWLRSERAA